MPNKRIIINKGDRFGKLIIVKEISPSILASHQRRRFLCHCDCGEYKETFLSYLMSGTVQSCGCILKNQLLTHGLSKTKIMQRWSGIKERCYNENDPCYERYGGRGIRVCEEWLKDSLSFYNWAINNGYKEGLSIDRINNLGDYTPDNCRWVDIFIQANNKRNNKRYLYNGTYATIPEICKQLGIYDKRKSVWQSINRYKKSLTEALSFYL